VGIRKNIEILRSIPSGNRKYAVLLILLCFALSAGLGASFWTTDHFHLPMSVFRRELVILLGGFIAAYLFIQRKSRARYQSLPPTEQRSVDEWRRDALLETKRHYKRWLAWIPIGTTLSIWEGRHEELRYRFLAPALGLAFFSWIFFTVRSMKQSIERLERKLAEPTSGETQ
jgi:hypothetical protein